MRGRPLVCTCPRCRLKGVSGHYWRIVWMGEEKPVKIQRHGRGSTAITAMYKNRCERCGHEWWSSYRGVNPEEPTDA